jgi:hypothetical protein
MPAIDESTLTQYFLEAAERGVMNAATHVEKRAKTLAPVRKIFASEKRGRGTHAVQLAVPAKFSTSGQPEVVNIREATGGKSRWKNRTGQMVDEIPGTSVARIGQQKIRGRVNSYAPVISTPKGFIGGVALRAWNSDTHTLDITHIRHPSGGSFKLADALTVRGRYEVASGRGAHMGSIGGRLHDSITTEGPRRNGMQVSAFVSASAHDPGRSHNYARDQEFGSRHNVKHPFLRPALRESTDFLRASVVREIRSGRLPKRSDDSNVRPVVLDVQIDISSIADAASELDDLFASMGA